jgi:hypothetical protein
MNKPVMPYGLLSSENRKTMSAFNKKYENSPIRMGCIIKKYEIDDDNNTTKSKEESSVVQYQVVVEQQEKLAITFTTYDKCICMTGFGGLADFFEYKLRDSNLNFEESYDYSKQNGSMVLLLCMDGFSEKAIIIGSLKHYKRKTKLTKEAGLHLEGEYNGLNWKVNSDGELTVTFKSATCNDGIPCDEAAGGSHIKMDKEGSIDLNANLDAGEETYIRMDKKNKDVGLKAGQHIGLTANKNIGFNAKGEISGKAKGAVKFEAEGTAKISAKSAIQLEGGSAALIKGGSVSIKSDSGVTIEGSKVALKSDKITLGNGGIPAVIQTTKFRGTGCFGVQVISTALGPFSKTVFIAS